MAVSRYVAKPGSVAGPLGVQVLQRIREPQNGGVIGEKELNGRLCRHSLECCVTRRVPL